MNENSIVVKSLNHVKLGTMRRLLKLVKSNITRPQDEYQINKNARSRQNQIIKSKGAESSKAAKKDLIQQVFNLPLC